MWRRPPGEGRLSIQHVAFAFLLLACLPLAEAQAQRNQRNEGNPQLSTIERGGDAKPAPASIHRDADSDDSDVPNWAATPIDAVAASRETISRNHAASPAPGPPQHRGTSKRRASGNGPGTDAPGGKSDPPGDTPSFQHGRYVQRKSTDTNTLNKNNNFIIPDDASALATLAPAAAVRAPHPPRHLKPSSSARSGLSSPQIARSLEDWEVEDFVLLATVDGDLYANDRKTGTERWHLGVDHPMVESHHHRANSSILDDAFSPVDHYIWAVEPNRDGGIYVWIPDSDAGLVRTAFTMKKIVEDLSPYADEDPPVVYTGDKKTTMVTLDAATGRVIKWFGPGGSHVNEDESCIKPNTLYDMDSAECSNAGTITLGRTEYTVGIQRRDGAPIATLKYSEWGPNNYDSDLWQQHHASLDSRYITSQHDGKVYGFDWARTESAAPLFNHKFSSPVARVFDVCRPWDAPKESNPELVVLPQPPMPSQDENIARMRSNSIFLNQTDAGSWYAMSGRAYPLIIDAPTAQIAKADWRDMANNWETTSDSKVAKALVGTHLLEPLRTSTPYKPSLPAGTVYGGYDDRDDDAPPPLLPAGETPEPTIFNKVKSLPQSAANSVVDFVSNPILIILFVVALFYNEKKLRRAYRRFRNGAEIKEAVLSIYADVSSDVKEDTSSDKDGSTDKTTTSLGSKGAMGDEANNSDPAVEGSAAVDDNDSISQLSPSTAKVEVPVNPTSTILEEAGVAGAEQQSQTTDGAEGAKPSPEASSETTDQVEGAAAEPVKKKKAHRGRRGGAKRRKAKAEASQSQSRSDDATPATVDEAVHNAKRLGDGPNLEPDVMTVTNDMQAVSGPIIKMGSMEVNTEKQLGTGSNGTLVFAGKFDGRDVAVKRMLIQFYDIASQETRLLRESDDHPNVIRYYSQQVRDGFLFIALERCAASLSDVVEKPSYFRTLAEAGQRETPSVLYQIANGLDHLHSLRIVHRDLKPQNILVNIGKDGRPRMLVSDFGLCKKLDGGQSSFGATTGRAAGTSGWRAPELLLDDDARDAGVTEFSTQSGSGSVLVNDNLNPGSRRATRAIDIFSLGLVFFYVITNGSHPFDCGDRYMREVNIRKGSYQLGQLTMLGDYAAEAKNLIQAMLQKEPSARPTTRAVMSHPFFWPAKKRLAFLCDVSDHFEKEVRDPPSPALRRLEQSASEVINGDFLRSLPRDFVESLGKQRKYTGTKLLDLLRALRNKRNHYEDMPDSLKRLLGALPDGYLGFWARRFPDLLLACWEVVDEVAWADTDRFREYYEPAAL